MAPKCKNSDAGSSDMPKRSYKVLLVSENVYIYVCIYVCSMYRKKCVYGSVLSVASGVHWGSWNISLVDKAVTTVLYNANIF